MKNTVLTYSFFAILSILIYGNNIYGQAEDSGESFPSFSDLRSYHSSKYSFVLEVPSDWTVVDQKNGIKISKEKDVTFVDLSVHDLTSADLNSYVTETVSKRNTGKNDFKLLELTQTMLSGDRIAFKAVYTFKSNPDEENIRKVLRYWTEFDDKVYAIGYVSDIEKYDTNLNVAQRIIDSLQVNASKKDSGQAGGDRMVGNTDFSKGRTQLDEQTQTQCDGLLETCKIPATKAQTENTNETKSSKQRESQFIFPEDTASKSFQDAGNVTNGFGITSDKEGQTILDQTMAQGIEPRIPELQAYENSTMGIKILHPNGWSKKVNNTNTYSIVSFLSPLESSVDKVRERLLLRINNNPTSMTLNEYTTRVNETLQNKVGFTIIEFNSTVLSGNPAYGVIGVERQGDKDVYVRDEWTIKNGIVYRIVFYLEDSKSSTYLPLVNEVIDSFTIIK